MSRVFLFAVVGDGHSNTPVAVGRKSRDLLVPHPHAVGEAVDQQDLIFGQTRCWLSDFNHDVYIFFGSFNAKFEGERYDEKTDADWSKKYPEDDEDN